MNWDAIVMAAAPFVLALASLALFVYALRGHR